MLPKDLTAASSTPLILTILSQGESYGYDIIKQVRDLSHGEITWTDGMLYPILHKLEKKGMITSEWKAGDNGRRRKYYRINEQGKQALAKEKENWHLITSMFKQLWNPHISLT